MNSVSSNDCKLALVNLIIDCSYPCVCTFSRELFFASHPYGSVWWVDGCNNEVTVEDALADAAERRDGLVVIHADEKAANVSIESVLCRWPKMSLKIMAYPLSVWNDVFTVLPWLGVRHAEGFIAAPVFPSVMILREEHRGALYLGSKTCTRDETLRATNVDAVVNCAGDACEEISSTRLVLELADDEEQLLDVAIEKAIPWIYQRIQRGLNVLVHCERGVSRSASIVVAYLVLRCGFTPTDALQHVTRFRQAANPNANFRKQLLRLKC